jgi:hypothetical protein
MGIIISEVAAASSIREEVLSRGKHICNMLKGGLEQGLEPHMSL